MPIKINKDAKVTKRKHVKLKATPPPRAQRMNYIKRTRAITAKLRSTGRRVKEMVDKGTNITIINDFIARQSKAMNVSVEKIAADMAANFIGSLDEYTEKRFINNVANALGVAAKDIASFPSKGELDQLLVLREAFIAENVELIKSISPQYFKDLTQALSANFRGIEQKDAKSLAGRIQDIGGMTDRRARFIARDQTAKVTTELSRTRNQALGANKYVWRTAKDQRVVGNPGGLYPKPTSGHGNHFAREGKTYFYSKPFVDGLPGQAFGCRCVDEPIINIDELLG